MAFCCAAVDLGATSGRVILGVVDDATLQAQEVHRFANVPVLDQGVRCWDVDDLFEQTLVGLSRAAERATAMGQELRSIGVDTWGVDYGLVDEEGRLLAPVRHYRAADEETRAAALAEVSALSGYACAGIAPMTINTSFQLFRDARDGLLGPGMTMLLIPDLWIAWLTGVVGAERTIASTTSLVDWATGDWSEDLIDRWNLPRGVFPDIVDSGSPAGSTLPTITDRIGAAEPVPVFRTASHDTASAFAAVASPDDGRVVISCGTWALVGQVASRPVLTQQALDARMSNEAAADGSAMVVRNLSGTWLLDECITAWARADGASAETLKSTVLEQAQECVPLPGTIDCASQELVRTTDMPSALVALHEQEHGAYGDPEGPGRGQIVRLVLDSLAASFAQTIDDLTELTPAPAREVVMIGGGSRLPMLRELTEQATGLPVRLGPREATSIGNMCVQAVASGIFPDLAAARAAGQSVEVVHG